MPPLRRTGIRQPWQPTPLESTAIADRLALTAVIVAQPPIPQSYAWFVGRPAPPEDIQWPARRATIALGPQPLANGAALTVGRVASVIEPSDSGNTRAVSIVTGQVPVPGAITAIVGSIRVPSALKPFAPLLITNQPPLPIANTQFVGVAHGLAIVPPDRVPSLSIVAGQTPQPLAPTQFIGRPGINEDIAWPARPASVIAGQTPTVGTVALSVGGVHDQTFAKLPTLALVVNQPSMPTGQAYVVGAIHVEATRLPSGVVVITPQPTQPRGLSGPAQAVGGIHGGIAVSTARLAPTYVISTPVFPSQRDQLVGRAYYTLAPHLFLAYGLNVYPRNQIDVVFENRNPTVPQDSRVIAVAAENRGPIVLEDTRIAVVIAEDRSPVV